MQEIDGCVQDRAVGALTGLAIGDALGTTVEFQSRDSYQSLETIVGGGVFQLSPGQWTDDTSMALCLAESLIETGRFDPADQLRRYELWFSQGHLSSTGRCFDIGAQTERAIQSFRRTGQVVAPSGYGKNDGNGSLMRLAPVPIVVHYDLELAAAMSAASSETTHPTELCKQSCSSYGLLIAAAIEGKSKSELIDLAKAESDKTPCAELGEVLAGSFLTKTREQISSSGYVIHTLEAALWAFINTDDFRTGALLAANLGEDADTVAAVYGQLAGAYYGLSGIPAQWVEILYESEMIIDMAKKLFALGGLMQ